MKILNSNFYKLLWIQDFLERFVEEFSGGWTLITNFGLTLLSCPGRQSRTAGFVRKPENWAKTFPHKTGSKRNIRLHKKCFWRAVCKCFGNFYSLSAFARAGIQLLQSPGLKLQKYLLKIPKHFIILHQTSAE